MVRAIVGGVGSAVKVSVVSQLGRRELGVCDVSCGTPNSSSMNWSKLLINLRLML